MIGDKHSGIDTSLHRLANRVIKNGGDNIFIKHNSCKIIQKAALTGKTSSNFRTESVGLTCVQNLQNIRSKPTKQDSILC